MSIILGIDPWTTTTWYALVERVWSRVDLIDYWVIETTPKIPLEEKLFEIGEDLGWLIDKYKPKMAVIEKLFFTTNLKTGIDVAHARGVILHEIYKRWILMKHFTPLELKSAICGNGKANKKQVQNAIKMILKMEEIPKPDDAADAIGLAYLWALQKEAF